MSEMIVIVVLEIAYVVLFVAMRLIGARAQPREMMVMMMRIDKMWVLGNLMGVSFSIEITGFRGSDRVFIILHIVRADIARV